MKYILYIIQLFLWMGSLHIQAQNMVNFESSTVGATTFTDHGQNFTITSLAGGNFKVSEYSGLGWNGTQADNKFIDNSGTAFFGSPFSFQIATQGATPFNLKSFYIYLSTADLETATGTLTIQGRKNNVVVFTATQATGFVNPNAAIATNGYNKIDLSIFGGADNSAILIDMITISGTGRFEYAALDAMNWNVDCSGTQEINGSSFTTCGSATVANLSVMGQNIKCYAAANATTPLAPTTALASGTYYVTQTVGTCESSKKSIQVIITPYTTQNDTAADCGSYTWAVNNETYTTSGIKTAVVGCVTHTLDLTITPNSTQNYTAAACGSYTWAVNNETYTTSGIKTAVIGCVTHTLDLTITPNSTQNYTAAACGSYTWAVNNETYTTSGIKTAVTGCVTHTLELTITPNSTQNYTAADCGTYTWAVNNQTYTTSGIKTAVIGCVTHNLDLTINSVDDEVTLSNGILTAHQAGGTYQWINCTNQTPISGAVAQQYTPTQVGTYQVEINWYNCVVLSDCITVTTLGIKNEEHHHIVLYPNPSKGIFYLRGIETATVSVYDISSKYIGRFNLKSQEEGVDLSNYPAGVYTIIVQDEKQKVKTFKFIKM